MLSMDSRQSSSELSRTANAYPTCQPFRLAMVSVALPKEAYTSAKDSSRILIFKSGKACATSLMSWAWGSSTGSLSPMID